MIHLKAGEGRIALKHEDIMALEGYQAAHIGARLRLLRRMNGMDEREFAKLVQEESIFIRRFENGAQLPPDKFLERVCKKTGARREWLVDGTGDWCAGLSDARAQAPGDVVQALAQSMADPECIRELEMGNWSTDGLNSNETVHEAEEDLENFLAARGILDEVEDLAAQVQDAAEFRGYENGMRYGARLVFQLLTGQSGAEADGMIQAAVRKLFDSETAQHTEAIS